MTAPDRLLEGRRDVLRNSKALLANDDVHGCVAERQPSSSARALRDWLANPEMLRLPEIVIPNLAVEGRVSLLSGREKVGKSTMVAGAVAAASRGDDVFGAAVPQPIRTLWYALDEPVSDAVRRFKLLGADLDGILINPEPRRFEGLLEALERDLEMFSDVGLVVIDTLSRVLAMSGVEPNSSREVEPVIAKLVDFFHRENVACILLYHTGKAGREYRGSTAIGATVDDVLTLRRRGQSDDDDFDDEESDDGRRLLVQDGRNLRGRVQLTFRNGAYTLFEENSNPRERIMEAFRNHGTVASRAKLVKLAAVRKDTGLKVINDLIDSGAVIEEAKGLTLGSSQSPIRGTATEPTLGTGSGFSNCMVAETGTDGRVGRVVHRAGQEVRQVLRPTQHGDKWFDVPID